MIPRIYEGQPTNANHQNQLIDKVNELDKLVTWLLDSIDILSEEINQLKENKKEAK